MLQNLILKDEIAYRGHKLFTALGPNIAFISTFSVDKRASLLQQSVNYAFREFHKIRPRLPSSL
jgi:hypothetical protein